MTDNTAPMGKEELRRIAEEAKITGVEWFQDHAPTDEVLAIADGLAVSVVAKVNPMAEWNDETAARWCAFIATFNPSRVLEMMDREAELEAEVLNAAFSDRLDMEAGGSPLTWKEVAEQAEASLQRVVGAAEKLILVGDPNGEQYTTLAGDWIVRDVYVRKLQVAISAAKEGRSSQEAIVEHASSEAATDTQCQPEGALRAALAGLLAVAEMTTFSDQYPAECEAARFALQATGDQS